MKKKNEEPVKVKNIYKSPPGSGKNFVMVQKPKIP
jgi:hypothetical protein